MNTAAPPRFCASATMCRATVVLPLLSGPKISTMRPLGTPPMPSAMSSERLPVGMASTLRVECSPNRMTAPLPNCFSIWERAASSAFCFSEATAAFFSSACFTAISKPPSDHSSHTAGKTPPRNSRQEGILSYDTFYYTVPFVGNQPMARIFSL